MLSGWLRLTEYGLSNFEMLLILVAIGALVGAGYRWQRRRWRDRALRSQSDLDNLRCQQEQLQNELAEVQRQNKRVESELGVAEHLSEQLRGELTIAESQITQLRVELAEVQRQNERVEERTGRGRTPERTAPRRAQQLQRAKLHNFGLNWPSRSARMMRMRRCIRLNWMRSAGAMIQFGSRSCRKKTRKKSPTNSRGWNS